MNSNKHKDYRETQVVCTALPPDQRYCTGFAPWKGNKYSCKFRGSDWPIYCERKERGYMLGNFTVKRIGRELVNKALAGFRACHERQHDCISGQEGICPYEDCIIDCIDRLTEDVLSVLEWVAGENNATSD